MKETTCIERLMVFRKLDKSSREDWLKWRHGGVGSSDAPIIMGVSRFKTIEQLLGEKTGQLPKDDSNKFIKERGNRIEPLVRKLYESEMQMSFDPVNVYNLSNPHLIASLDGMDPDSNLIIEIKLMTTAAPGQRNIETTGYKKWLEAKDNQTIPEDYYPQLQHQLGVTGLPSCVFIGLREARGFEPKLEDLAIVSVLRDDEYISKLTLKSNEFWSKVLRIKGEING